MEDLQLYEEMNAIDQLLAEQNPRAALALLTKVRSQIEPNQEKVLARSYAWEIICYKNTKDISNALSAADKGLKIYQKLNDKLGISRIYRDMALVYEDDKQYEKALQYIDLALEAAEQDTSDAVLASQYKGITLSKKAEIHKEMGKLEDALRYAQEGYDTVQQGTDLGFKLNSCLILARIHTKMKMYDDAQKHISQSEDYLEQIKKTNGYLNEKRYSELQGLRAMLSVARNEKEPCLYHFKNILTYMLKPIKQERKRVWDVIEIEVLYNYLKERGHEEDIKTAISAYYREHKGEVDWEPHDIKEEMRDNKSTH